MPRNSGLRWKCHGKTRGYVQSLFHEHLLNDHAVHPGRSGILPHITLNLVFSLQALWESSGREVLWLRCSELTVGLANTSHSAGASQPPLVYCCSCASPAYLRAVPGSCWRRADAELAFIWAIWSLPTLLFQSWESAELDCGWRWKAQLWHTVLSRTVKICALHTK